MSQIQRWGSPRQREQAPSVAPQEANTGGTSPTRRWPTARDRDGGSGGASVQPVTPSSGFARGVPRRPSVSAPAVTAEDSAQPSQGIARTPSSSASVTPVDSQRAATSAGARTAQPRRAPGPGDYPQNANVAVPRGSNPLPRDDDGTIYVPRTSRIYTSRVYTNYYYYPPYPRHYYPYGYGGFGLGYFYYDPFNWYDTYYPTYPLYGNYYSGSYYGGGYTSGPVYATGEIRLQIRPRYAEVYVDGYYAGRVDEFDGFLQSLRLEEGPHTIEIVAPGYETLVFNVRIVAGRKIDYRADLNPE